MPASPLLNLDTCHPLPLYKHELLLHNHDPVAPKMGEKELDIDAELLAAGKQFDKVRSPLSPSLHV